MEYKENFLSNVIFKIDFTSVSELFTSIPEEIDSLLKKSCPTLSQKEAIEYQAIIENGKKTDRERRFTVFIYTNDETSHSITVTHNYILFEFKKYETYTNFKQIIENIAPKFISKLNITDISRVGLRYINQIVLKRGNPFLWSGYVDSSLTSVIDKFFKKSPSTLRAIGQVIFNNDDYNVNFIYGTPNSEYPAKISRKEFLIDIDCYSTFIEGGTILPSLDKFNTKAKELFEDSIKSKLRDKMGIITNEQ